MTARLSESFIFQVELRFYFWFTFLYKLMEL